MLAYSDHYDARVKASYVYTRLYVSLVSASHPFVAGVRATIHRLLGLRGELSIKQTPGGRPVWNLRYAKKASVRPLTWMYYAPGLPCLARKRAKPSHSSSLEMRVCLGSVPVCRNWQTIRTQNPVSARA